MAWTGAMLATAIANSKSLNRSIVFSWLGHAQGKPLSARGQKQRQAFSTAGFHLRPPKPIEYGRGACGALTQFCNGLKGDEIAPRGIVERMPVAYLSE
jgi:hypothetical protein